MENLEIGEEILKCIKDMGILSVNLNTLVDDIPNLLKKINKRKNLIRAPRRFFDQSLIDLNDSLIQWCSDEALRHPHNTQCRDEIQRCLYYVKIKFALASCPEIKIDRMNSLLELVRRKASLDNLICYSIKKYIFHDICDGNLSHSSLCGILASQFGIHLSLIQRNEFKAMSIRDMINEDELEKMVKLIWGSPSLYDKFEHRYQVLTEAEQFIREEYMKHKGSDDKKLTLTVAVSAFPNYPSFATGQEIEFCSLGMPNSDRYCGDSLVIFSKESEKDFLCDVRMPNDHLLNDLQMMILYTAEGFKLIDLWSVIFKKLRKTTVLSNGAVFQVNNTKIKLERNEYKTVFTCIAGEEAKNDNPKSFEIEMNNPDEDWEIFIGSAPNCHFNDGRYSRYPRCKARVYFYNGNWHLQILPILHEEEEKEDANGKGKRSRKEVEDEADCYLRLNSIEEENKPQFHLIEQGDLIKIKEYRIIANIQ